MAAARKRCGTHAVRKSPNPDRYCIDVEERLSDHRVRTPRAGTDVWFAANSSLNSGSDGSDASLTVDLRIERSMNQGSRGYDVTCTSFVLAILESPTLRKFKPVTAYASSTADPTGSRLASMRQDRRTHGFSMISPRSVMMGGGRGKRTMGEKGSER